jgi:hypothetical protein
MNYSLVVVCPAVTVGPASLPGATVGTAYSQTMTASGPNTPYTFSVTLGSLPVGLTLSSGGTLGGTSTATGTYTFTVTAADAYGCSGSLPYSITAVCPTVSVGPSSLTGATVGTPYTKTMTASGGTAPYTFAATGTGSLPTGLTLSSDGLLSGTPTAAGTYSFTVTATDAHGCTGASNYSIAAVCPTVSVAPLTLPGGTVGTFYIQTITASGGIAPYTFGVSAGDLPPGLTLATGGTLAGVPSSAGTFTFTVTATDTNGCTGNVVYSGMAMVCPAVTVGPASLPGATVGTSYSQIITAAGGTAPYSFFVSAGSLPPGLTLSAGGLLGGTVSGAGTFAFTLSATDKYGCSGGTAYSLTMVCQAISVGPSSLPAASVAAPYSQTVTAAGGMAPYTFAVTGTGSLPTGLTLSSGGLLSGTPTAAGTYSFTVTATDAYGCTGTRTYTLAVVNPPVISLIKKVSPPFKLVVTGSNLQNGIRVYIDGLEWTSVIWKNTGKIQLTGAIKTLFPKGLTRTFRFVNPDGGEVTTTWNR